MDSNSSFERKNKIKKGKWVDKFINNEELTIVDKIKKKKSITDDNITRYILSQVWLHHIKEREREEKSLVRNRLTYYQLRFLI